MEASPIVIKSFLANPEGRDKGGEYFNLYNAGDQTVNLSSWRVQDLSGKSYFLYGEIAPKQELSFPAGSKLTLNNNGETLYLLNPQGATVDELGYIGSAVSGRLIQKHLELSQEIKEEMFEPLALANPSSIAQKSGLSSFALFSVLSLTILGFLAHKHWPKSQSKKLSEQYGETSFF